MKPSVKLRSVESALAEKDGSADSTAALMSQIYDELRVLAEALLDNERSDHTLQPTALVHEAYMRLKERSDDCWQNRQHFYRAAAQAMRRVLVNHAVKHKRPKHGSGKIRLILADSAAIQEETDIDLVVLDEALTRLAEVDSQKCSVVELRYFGGCTIAETAQALGISTATVEREWRTARAWLRSEMVPE